MKTPDHETSPAKFVLFGICFAALLVIGISIIYKVFAPTTHFSSYTQAELEFSSLDDASLSSEVKSLLLLAKSEYDNPRPGEFYAGGTWEPWCADFVSYIYREAGYPFENPNTGSWRIPGIYTLREYLQAHGFWYPKADYTPVPGDIVIYDGGLFGGHTNIVVKVDGDYLVTVGGNEDNQIRLDRFQWTADKYGIQGFGHLID